MIAEALVAFEHNVEVSRAVQLELGYPAPEHEAAAYAH